jgi:site-specific DNA recombinase
MPKRLIPCGRVSSDEQAKDGTSLESQVAANIRYIESIGAIALEPILDDVSGITPIAERPGGKRIVEQLKSGVADGTVWYTPDRFYRDDLEARLQCRQWVKDGIELHFADHGQVKDDSDLVFMLQSWHATKEREKIIERTSRGRRTKAEHGKWVGQGRKALYGYQKVGRAKDCTIEINDVEIAIVKRMRKWFMEGDVFTDNKPLTLRHIAVKLSEINIPTPTATSKRHGVWNPTTVRRILVNEAYTGVWRYGLRKGKQGKSRRPIEETIPVSIPAVFTRDEWLETLARVEHNKRMSQRNCKYQYLLRGLIECACGGRMVGCPGWKPAHWYRCGTKGNRYAGLEPVYCAQPNARVERIDEWVWQQVLDLFNNKEDFEQALRDAQEEERNAQKPRQDRLAELESMMLECEAEAEEITSALKKVRSDGLLEKTLKNRSDMVEDTYASYTQERNKLIAELSAQTLSDEDIETALQFRKDAASGLQVATYEAKRHILEILQTELKAEGETIRLKFKIELEKIRRFNIRDAQPRPQSVSQDIAMHSLHSASRTSRRSSWPR